MNLDFVDMTNTNPPMYWRCVCCGGCTALYCRRARSNHPQQETKMDFDQQAQLRQVFLESNRILSDRHLYHSAKWSSEALNGMPQLTREQQYAEYQMARRNAASNKSNISINHLISPLSSAAFLESNATTGSAFGSGAVPATGNMHMNSPRAGVPNAEIGVANADRASGAQKFGMTGNSLSANMDLQNTSDQNINNNIESEDFLQFVERDKIALSSSYFSCKEFGRCYQVLKGCRSAKAVFIRLYALYLSGEKKKAVERGAILGQNDSNTTNPHLSAIIREIEEYKRVQKLSHLNDPFLLYLQGVIFLKSKKLSHAQEMFYQSLSLYPFNWTCWKELISSLSTFNEAHKMINRFKRNPKFTDKREFLTMFLFFKITVYQEFFQISNEMLIDLNELSEIFPNFSFLKTQKALISYNELDYNTAESIFDDILKNDPMRLDEIDVYSNILYVMENKSKLSFLARYASEVDPLRPETCCVIANYHSIKFDHQKAIMYYKRALSLNDDCLSAWTLMGHEFVELKNSNAAIESYRRAVDTNNKDFRAWYGLGQAYEVLDMHLYSLYYYQRACSLKPMDKRMWQAIGNCCEKLEEFEDSIKAYKKALSVSVDSDPMILYKLGMLYSNIDDLKNAKSYMKLCLEDELNGDITDETTKARLWLARHEASNKKWQLAYNYAVQLTQGTSQEIEEARGIAREAKMKLTMMSSGDSRQL